MTNEGLTCNRILSRPKKSLTPSFEKTILEDMCIEQETHCGKDTRVEEKRGAKRCSHKK